MGPEVLDICRRAVDASGAALWRRLENGSLACAWRAGDSQSEPHDVEQALRGDAASFHAAPVAFAGRQLGALIVAVDTPLGADDALFLETAADLLAPLLGAAEHAHRLEAEVAARTRDLEEQRHFVAQVVDSLPLGLYVTDRDYRVQMWNRKRETGMQGISRDEALGRRVFDVLHRQPEEELRDELREVFESGRVQQFQTESSASGELRTFRITKIPMRADDAGPVTHVITVGEDVTEWREAQDRIAQAEKLAAIGTLTAGVMHEINNPLATIAACAEVTALRVDEDGDGMPEALRGTLREAFRLIDAEVHRCRRIVDGLLDFSRPKSDGREPVDMAAVIEHTLFLLKHHPRFKQLLVIVDPAQGPPPIVEANEEQLVQVFMALLLNAVDAMDSLRGRGTVALRVRTLEREVTAEVEDQGEGIRSADRQKIFEPFFTTKPPGRGTGLGLSVCYSIVSEHGGRIEVDSRVGEGSTFRIVLPRLRDSVPAATA